MITRYLRVVAITRRLLQNYNSCDKKYVKVFVITRYVRVVAITRRLLQNYNSCDKKYVKVLKFSLLGQYFVNFVRKYAKFYFFMKIFWTKIFVTSERFRHFCPTKVYIYMWLRLRTFLLLIRGIILLLTFGYNCPRQAMRWVISR